MCIGGQADMESVIDLVSSDEEDEPVVCTTQVDIPNSKVLKQVDSKVKIERDGVVPEDDDDHIGSCSTSDQAHGITGDQTERRAKVGALGKGKSAVGSAGITPVADAQEKSLCRHFWQAGDYEAQAPKRRRPLQGAMDHVRVHPKFLHSNATSHKWALGAVAELLDNSIDEIQNGATYVRVDKILSPKDGSPALLVQDDGGGMSPDDIRQCMSLGYSRKNTNATIGQYGNGFKTSTMRLGADVIVFTRNDNGRNMTQSIGLLSYTFLRKTGREDIVVPMVDYQLSSNGVKPSVLLRTNMEDWLSNLSTVMRWSPYSSEEELLRQFDDLGWHGTKVIVFNLWLNDDGILELDFDSDDHDIQLRVGSKEAPKQPNLPSLLAKEHISNRYRFSLRAYASILYLHMPEQFKIVLRGELVEHHSIAMDLKFTEYIIYKPQIGVTKDAANKEASVITTIGFTKEAPLINVHGFNVYHKNRLIMPFWKVFQENSSRGRGVVGVLEANFIEPAHDKQDFERTSVFLRLEGRLKAMTIEYWNLHCHLIGYKKPQRVKSAASVLPNQATVPPAINTPTMTPSSPTSSSSSDQLIITHENLSCHRRTGVGGNTSSGTVESNGHGHGHGIDRNLAGSAAASAPPTPPRAGADCADGLAETSVPRTELSSGKLVKTEVGENNNNNGERVLKRPRDSKELSLLSKRPRNDIGDAVPLASRGAGDDLAVAPENEGLLTEALEQNSLLRQKCSEYEMREKHWEQKLIVHEQRERNHELQVAALEKQLMEHKTRYTKLIAQMDALKVKGLQVNKEIKIQVETGFVVKSELEDLVVPLIS